jgi:hypothetical protein
VLRIIGACNKRSSTHRFTARDNEYNNVNVFGCQADQLHTGGVKPWLQQLGLQPGCPARTVFDNEFGKTYEGFGQWDTDTICCAHLCAL